MNINRENSVVIIFAFAVATEAGAAGEAGFAAGAWAAALNETSNKADSVGSNRIMGIS